MARLESRVKPLRDQNDVLLAAYDEFFAEDFKQILELTREIIDTATALRAKYNFKTRIPFILLLPLLITAMFFSPTNTALIVASK